MVDLRHPQILKQDSLKCLLHRIEIHQPVVYRIS